MSRLQFLTHALLLFVRQIVLLIEKLWRPPCKDRIEIKKILAKSKPFDFAMSVPSQFITWHQRFESDHNYLLRDDVLFYAADLDRALFLRLKGPIATDYDPVKAPFLFLKAFEDAQEAIFVPWDAVHNLARILGPIKSKVVLISSTGRCGSTLLTQLLHGLNPKQSIGYNEFGDLFALQDVRLRTRTEDFADFKLKLSSILRINYRNRSQDPAHPTIYISKYRFPAIDLLETIESLMPNTFHHVFLQRKDELKTVLSYEKAFGHMIHMKIYRIICALNLHELAMKGSATNLAPEINAHNRKMGATIFEICVAVWANVLCYYRHLNGTGVIDSFPRFYFEDLIERPEEVLREIAVACSLPVEDLPNAIRLLGNDAQANTPLSVKNLGGRSFKSVYNNPEVKKRVNNFCRLIHVKCLFPDEF